VFAPCQRQRVDHALGGDRRLARSLQPAIKKGNVKAGVVCDERRIADERLAARRRPQQITVCRPEIGQ